MSIYTTRPHWMSDVQWEAEQTANARMAKAVARGLGIVQTSARRYAVIEPNGTSYVGDSATGFAHVHYQQLARNLTWQDARSFVRKLLEAEAQK